MFKKIKQFFLKTEENKTTRQYGVERSADHCSESPHSAEEFKKIGDKYFKSRELAQAGVHYKQSLEIDPNQFEVYKNWGVVYYYQGELDEAIKHYDQAIALKPDYPEAYSNRGLALNDLNRLEEALVSLDRAIELKEDFAFAYNNRGMVLKKLNRLEDALLSYDRAVELKPNFAEAHNNRGTALSSLKRYDEALFSFDQAIELKTDYVEAYCNRGDAYKWLGKFKDALASFDQAVAINPNFADAYYYQGLALCLEGRKDKSLASFNRAVELKPDYAEAYSYSAYVLKDLKKLSEAQQRFKKAIELKPDIEVGYGGYCETKLLMCDWRDFDNHLLHIEKLYDRKKIIAKQLQILWLANSPALIKKLIEIQTATTFPIESRILPPIVKHPKHKKIRVAYFSGEFYEHPVALLTAGLFEHHDKSKFEIIAFSSVKVKDQMTERLMASFDRFIDANRCSDKEVVEIARDMEIDIAIDLGGYTGEGGAHFFVMRVAPIQINYIGYPGTMGADFMDYIIADSTIIPAKHQQHYTEKVVYLPSFQANDTQRPISDRKFTRQELGLPLTGFVFCCFNTITKINPHTFDSWMRILKQVEGSVLWMLDENEIAVKNLKKEVELRGVDSNRLVLAKRVEIQDYLARYRMADLFLDTLPYNAGTTASDALWAGLPVLTQMGETFAGRMAASLLNAIHLPELITTTAEDYEALAVELATNPEKLAEIKQKLADNRLTTPLFDIEYFTRNIESAYTQMYERYHAGLPPDHIYTDKK